MTESTETEEELDAMRLNASKSGVLISVVTEDAEEDDSGCFDEEFNQPSGVFAPKNQNKGLRERAEIFSNFLTR
jgi:hypothetical protein